MPSWLDFIADLAVDGNWLGVVVRHWKAVRLMDMVTGEQLLYVEPSTHLHRFFEIKGMDSANGVLYVRGDRLDDAYEDGRAPNSLLYNLDTNESVLLERCYPTV